MHRWQGSEQRHFKSQAEGQDYLRQTVLYDYNSKSNVKQVKQFHLGSELASSLLQLPTVKARSTILWKNRVITNLLSQMDLSGSVCHICWCFKLWDLSSFCLSFGKYLFYTCRLRNTELQIHEIASPVKKLCLGRCKSQGLFKLFPWYLPQPSEACNFAFSSRFTIGSNWSGHSLMTARRQVFAFLGAHWLTFKGCNH